MRVINALNVNDALFYGMNFLATTGRRRGSRNGEVLVADGPVTTVYQRPTQRVLFWPERDANPFFHLYESLWMLAGYHDVYSVARYVDRMKSFSDDGITLHGAYGFRWREHFGSDQLPKIIRRLKNDPDDRRCVLQMWDARADLDVASKDLPCNTQVYFSRTDLGRLDMTVCCRSNDIIWGAYGANAVHFSVLQEYVAAGIGCEVGTYYQISNNYHAYTSVFDALEAKRVTQNGFAPLPYNFITFDVPLVEDFERFNRDLFAFMDHRAGITEPFLANTAIPMQKAYFTYKNERDGRRALEISLEIAAPDWRRAACEWLSRRITKNEKGA